MYGYVYVFSGRTQQILLQKRHPTNSLGSDIALAGDLDNDTYPDYVIGGRGHESR